MLSVIDPHGQTPTTTTLRRVLPRGAADADSMIPMVKPVVDGVAAHGMEVAVKCSEKSDRTRPVSMCVPAEVIDAVEAVLENNIHSALQEPTGRVYAFHATQKLNGKTVKPLPDGIVREK